MRRLQRYVDRPTVGFLVYGVSVSAMFISLAMGFGIMAVSQGSAITYAFAGELFSRYWPSSLETMANGTARSKKLQLTPDRKKPILGGDPLPGTVFYEFVLLAMVLFCATVFTHLRKGLDANHRSVINIFVALHFSAVGPPFAVTVLWLCQISMPVLDTSSCITAHRECFNRPHFAHLPVLEEGVVYYRCVRKALLVMFPDVSSYPGTY